MYYYTLICLRGYSILYDLNTSNSIDPYTCYLPKVLVWVVWGRRSVLRWSLTARVRAVRIPRPWRDRRQHRTGHRVGRSEFPFRSSARERTIGASDSRVGQRQPYVGSRLPSDEEMCAGARVCARSGLWWCSNWAILSLEDVICSI